MSVRVYNTLTKTKQPLDPVTPGKVGIYLCGPTVYKEAHIGHMVGPVIFDCIKRYLQHAGHDVTWVVNITDVDDKLIAEANRRGISMQQVAEENTRDYEKNLAALGVDTIDHMPKATEHIDEIVAFIASLVAAGFAYQAGGDVYFEVGRDPEYGKLSNRTPEGLQGEGGEGAAKKRAPGDFALWKAAKPGEPSWPSPWGDGRPGWHIECSAMSRRLLGETFDIHGGGLDLIFPHHENEIAQSECCHGKPMARYWLHNGLLKAAQQAGKLGGRADRQAAADADAVEKMSRSKGAGGLADLIARYGGETLRFFLVRTHYRSTILFGEQELNEARAAMETFYRLFERYDRIVGESFYRLETPTSRPAGEFDPRDDALLQEVRLGREAFLSKMDDDFNTGAAMSELFELVRAVNRFIDQHQLEDPGRRPPDKLDVLRRAMLTLRELTAVLGLFRAPVAAPAEASDALLGDVLELLIEVRADARQEKNFAMSDKIRDRLAQLGITLEDRKDGTLWRKG